MIFVVTIERHVREASRVEVDAGSMAEARDLAVDAARRGDVIWEGETTAIEVVGSYGKVKK